MKKLQCKHFEFLSSHEMLKDFLKNSNSFQLPQIAFAGKSNTGKSTLINFLCNHASLAKTSQKPGKTTLLQFFKIDHSYLFVDLPGYGFAKVPLKERKKWGDTLENFFSQNLKLSLVIFLLDIRRDPSENDLLFWEYLHFYKIPHLCILTKSDKLKTHELGKREIKIQQTLKTTQTITYSYQNKYQKKILLNQINEILNGTTS